MLVTPLFAALFGILYFLLSINVVRHRFSKQVSLGDGDDKYVERAIRIHANFIEYVPLILVLFYFYEIMTLSGSLVFVLGSSLLLARICHVVGMIKPRQFLVLRQIGALVTFSVLLIVSLALAIHYLPVSV